SFNTGNCFERRTFAQLDRAADPKETHTISKDQARSEATATSKPTPFTKREKRTITEIRESKKTKEKMV
ncbi:MAG: hypothetical protein WCB52_03920, partial [Pseudolabrys sp.]